LDSHLDISGFSVPGSFLAFMSETLSLRLNQAGWNFESAAESLALEFEDLVSEITGPSSTSVSSAADSTPAPQWQESRDVQKAIDAARQILDYESRSLVLAAVAVQLEPLRQQEVLQLSLALARQMPDELSRGLLLAVIPTRLKGQPQLGVPVKTFGVGWPIPAASADGQPANRTAAPLGPDWQQEVLQQSLDQARQIAEEPSRSEALAAVAARLNPEQSLSLLQEMLEESGQGTRASCCDRLALLLPALARLGSPSAAWDIKEALLDVGRRWP
jgi:hypothetical protein